MTESLMVKVRGHAKEQARERAAKKADAHKGGTSQVKKIITQRRLILMSKQLKARAAGVQIICSVCRGPISSYKIYVQHMETKHPNAPILKEEELSNK
jgi:hypothetical protein